MKGPIRLVGILIVLGAIGAAGYYLIAKPSTTKSTAVAVNTAAATLKPLTIVNGKASLVTPLDKGYLFYNPLTRTIKYADAALQTVDITARFLLNTNPRTTQKLNSVVDIQPMANGNVLVVTTRGIFVASSSSKVFLYPVPDRSDWNLSVSAFDAASNTVYVASAYSRDIYRYDLSQPAGAPTLVIKAPKDINRLSAGQGIVVAHFDDVPSTESKVLDAYAKTRQLDPLVIDGAEGKVIATLNDFTPATYLSVSGSGKYIAIKRKFASQITIYDRANKSSTTLDSYDTGGASWRGDTFFVAHSQAIWSYDATSASSELVKVADMTTPITHLTVTAKDILAGTNSDTTFLLVPPSQTKVPFVVRP